MKIVQNYTKISFCMVTGFFLICITAIASNANETYPSKPVQLTVGFVAGGSSDTMGRLLAAATEKVWRQPTIVINKPGAASAIQMEFVKNAAPDGYTLGVYTTGGMTATHLKEIPYHFFSDFTHICGIANALLGIVVHSDSPWRNLRDLVEYGQKNPGKLRYAATEPGTPVHLLTEQLAYLNNSKWVHVPTQGDNESLTTLLGKHVDAITCTVLAWGPHVKAGRLRALAVFSDERLREFPDVPTAKELGFPLSGWALYGIFGPKIYRRILEKELDPR